MANSNVDVILGTYDNMICGLSYDLLADAPSFQRTFSDKGHTASVRSLASFNQYLVSGSADETIGIYDIRSRTEVGSLLQHEGTVTSLQFHQQHLLSASDDGTIWVWDIGTWESRQCLTGHRGPVYSIAVHPTGNLVLSVGRDKTLRTWDFKNGQQAYVKHLPKAAHLVLWNTIGDHYLLVCEASITCYSLETGRATGEIEVIGHVNAIVFINNSTIAIGCESHDVLVYSVITFSCLGRLEGHTNRVKALQFVSGADLLFSASSSGSVRAWKMSNDITKCVCMCEIVLPVRIICMALVYPEEFDKELKRARKPKAKKCVQNGEKKKDIKTDVKRKRNRHYLLKQKLLNRKRRKCTKN